MAKLLDTPAFAQMWREAIQDFAKETKVNLNDMSIPPPKSVEELIDSLKDKHQEFRQDTSSGLQCTKYLRAAFGPFNLLNNTLGGAAGVAFPPSSQILGAVSVLVSAANETTKSFDAVSGLFEKLTSFGDRLNELCSVKISNAMHPILIKILVTTLKVLALATKRAFHPKDAVNTKHPNRDRLSRVFKSNVSQFLRQLFMGDDPEISAAMAELDKLLDDELRMTTTSTFKNTQNIDDRTVKIDHNLTTLTRNVTLLIEGLSPRVVKEEPIKAKNRQSKSLDTTKKSGAAKEVEKSKQLIAILQPYPNCAAVLESLQARVPNTTDGLVVNAAVKKWFDREIQVLHLVGDTGSGKTFAAGRIVDELQKRVKQHGSMESARMFPAYYFKSNEIPDACMMLRTLALQIASVNPIYAQHAIRINKKSPIVDMDIDQLWTVLFADYFTEAKSPAFLVLDGVDELHEDKRNHFLACLGNKHATNGSKLPIGIQLMLITKISDRERIQTLFGHARAEIEPDVEHDFPAFVKSRLRTAWGTRLVTNELFARALGEIIAASKGNYLQASLIIDEIASLSREQDVRRKIAALPRNLIEAAPLVIDRLKRQLAPQDQEDLTDMIGWVASSKRYLSIAELDALLTLRSLEGARVLDLEEQLRHRYASLFVLSGKNDAEYDFQERIAKRLTETEQSSITSQKQAPDRDKGKDHQSIKMPLVDQNTTWQPNLKHLDDTMIRIEHHLLANHIRGDSTRNIIAGQSLDVMRLNALIGCLDILCYTRDVLQEAQKKARSYCAAYFADHLKEVNPANVAPGKKLNVVRRLLQLFRDPKIIDRWLELDEFYMAADLALDSDFINSFVAWISDESVQSSVPQPDQEWIKNALASPIKNILGLLALGHARRWLRTTDGVPESNFAYLSSYLDLSGVLPLNPKESESAEPYESYRLERSSINRITEIANWAGFTQDALWLARLARALRDAHHLDASIEYFHRSLELDPTKGLFHGGLRVAFTLKKEPLKAIECSVRAIELVKDDIKNNRPCFITGWDHLSYLIYEYRDIADLQRGAGQTEQAIKNYGLVLEGWTDKEAPNWAERVEPFISSFKSLTELGQYDYALKQLIRFNSHPKRLEKDFLIIYEEFLFDPVLARIGYGTRQPDLVDAFYTNAMWTTAKYGEDYEVSALRYNRARTLLKLDSNRRDEAQQILTEVIRRESDEELATLWSSFIKQDAEKALSVIYLDNILQARENDAWVTLGQQAEELVTLIKDSKASRAADDARPSDCFLTLAAWARTNGRKKRARGLAGEHLNLGIEMLSDDDDDNDAQAWYYLCDALLVLGDKQRTQTAVFAQLRQRLKTSLETTSSASEHGGSEAAAAYYFCDGPCFKDIPVQNRFYRCSYCVSDLCVECYDKLMKDEMKGWNVCGKLHEHMCFDGISELYDKDLVKVGDELISFSKWLADLKADYGLIEEAKKLNHSEDL
ncbi:hypothetical protein F5Y19DRAFT_415793 [Xylariaceae sp. FL1651]|nr:hypothetical protein F5Y19DRAFT_415793 [Xylariaceae sp. FL1651]